MEKDIYSRIAKFFQEQAVQAGTKENLRKVLSADQFSRQYPSNTRRFAGVLNDYLKTGVDRFKGTDFKGFKKVFNKVPSIKNPVNTGAVSSFFKSKLPVAQGVAGNVFALPAMGEVFRQGDEDSFITRNVNALSETPFGLKVNEETDIGKRAGDFLLNLVRSGAGGDPITGGVLGGPLPNVSPSNVPSMEESLEKYGFNDNFELQPSKDGTFKVVQSKKGLEEAAYKDFLERTKNSPAMRAGVFDPRDLFKQSQMNDAFQAARNAGTLEQFAQQYPNSQTAKQFAIDKRIPTPLDMEF